MAINIGPGSRTLACSGIPWLTKNVWNQAAMVPGVADSHDIFGNKNSGYNICFLIVYFGEESMSVEEHIVGLGTACL